MTAVGVEGPRVARGVRGVRGVRGGGTDIRGGGTGRELVLSVAACLMGDMALDSVRGYGSVGALSLQPGGLYGSFWTKLHFRCCSYAIQPCSGVPNICWEA